MGRVESGGTWYCYNGKKPEIEIKWLLSDSKKLEILGIDTIGDKKPSSAALMKVSKTIIENSRKLGAKSIHFVTWIPPKIMNRLGFRQASSIENMRIFFDSGTAAYKFLAKKKVASLSNRFVLNLRYKVGPIFSSRSPGKKPDRWKGMKLRSFIRKPI